MEVNCLSNPYDFANPVIKQEFFVGREEERKEIEYYLDHAAGPQRPINLAILGERAAGKTSLLNFIEFKAKERKLCVVRVDLDEGDSATQLPFFFKIFDSICSEVFRIGAFGGINGKTYDTYRDIVDAFVIPENKTFCPFIFPIQYAKAMKAGNPNDRLSDNIFKEDLKVIREEIKTPIVLMFDEGDVLSQSRVHLEKIRNIFMAVPGYMLVIAGTPNLFPLIDKIFSPIVRQFKKINIGPFTEEEETEACIKKPLENLEIGSSKKIFDSKNWLNVKDIHDLSGGRPYEIQLICHFLFRRFQDGQSKTMVLDLEVIEDVRKELASAQDLSRRPIISAIQNLENSDLSILGRLLSCNKHATIDQIHFAEYVFYPKNSLTKTALFEKLKFFEKLNIIAIENGVIKFLGDDFDRIYCKYWAKKYGVLLNISSMPYEILITIYTEIKVSKIKTVLDFAAKI